MIGTNISDIYTSEKYPEISLYDRSEHISDIYTSVKYHEISLYDRSKHVSDIYVSEYWSKHTTTVSEVSS
jgi:hypothetical protein